MHSVKEQYRDINPVTVNVIEANVTSSLYCGMVRGIEAPGVTLVEAFLVELYRCRVCQFTSSLESNIKTHLLDSHDDLLSYLQKDGSSLEEVGVEDQTAQRDSPYHLDHDLTLGSKHSDDDPMDHIGFLLPMYGILPGISDVGCLGSNCDASLQVAQTCEVSTLFEDEPAEDEEDSAMFQLKDCSDGACSQDVPCPASRPTNQDDQLAQSVHLMTLGLCRISKTPPASLGAAESRLRDAPLCPDDSAAGTLHGEESHPALGGWKSCSSHRRMRKDRRMKSSKLFKCRLCLRSFRTRRSCDMHTCDARARNTHAAGKRDVRTSNATTTDAAGTHSIHEPDKHTRMNTRNKNTTSAHSAHRPETHTSETQTLNTRTSETQTSNTHMSETHACDTHTAETHACNTCMSETQACDTHTSETHACDTYTSETHACDHEDWLSCVFCDYKDTARVKGDEPRVKGDEPQPSDQDSHRHGLCEPLLRYTSRRRRHQVVDPPTTTHGSGVIPEKKKKKKEKKKDGRKKSPAESSGRPDVCCLLCNRKFSSRLTLRRHMGIHQGHKPFSCQHCPYRSRLKASLLQHVRIHTGEKPFRCPDCSYASIDRSSLLRHSRTHSQEKPYCCQFCPYSSIQKKSLDLHARRHHTGESFPCQQCQYSSPDRQLLQRHVRRHHHDQPVTTAT